MKKTFKFGLWEITVDDTNSSGKELRIKFNHPRSRVSFDIYQNSSGIEMYDKEEDIGRWYDIDHIKYIIENVSGDEG